MAAVWMKIKNACTRRRGSTQGLGLATASERGMTIFLILLHFKTYLYAHGPNLAPDSLLTNACVGVGSVELSAAFNAAEALTDTILSSLALYHNVDL